MFKRYPYTGWLLLAIMLWGVTGYHFYAHRQSFAPARMAHMVAKDIQKRERALHELLIQNDLVQRLFADSLSGQEENMVLKQPFYLFAYNKSNLIFCNTNELLVNASARDSGRYTLLSNDQGVFLQRCLIKSDWGAGRKLIILIPIFRHYPIENNYLKSNFPAADHIPLNTRVLPAPSAGAVVINGLTGNPLFYLLFHPEDFGRWSPDSVILWLLLAAILTSALWVQLIAVYLTRTRSYISGLIFTLVVVVGLRCLTYIYGLPFNLENIALFSPSLYASSAFLSSLGALFINALCCLWIIVFIIRHTPYQAWFKNIKPVIFRYFFGLIISGFLVRCCIYLINIIRSLVIDSSISFDVSHFYSINVNTIFGLFTIALITGISCLVTYLLHSFTANLIGNPWIRYCLLAVTGCVLVLCVFDGDPFLYFLVGWLVVFVFFLDIKRLSLVSDLFAPQTVFWAVLICLFCTLILQYFNHIKEHESRKVFANQHIAPQRDNLTEYAFKAVSTDIEKDRLLRSFFKKPLLPARKLVNEQLDTRYLGGQLNKYEAKVYLFDKNQHNIFNKDTIGYSVLMDEINACTPTETNTLFYKEYLPEGHHYMVYIPVANDSAATVLGYVFIDLSLKKAVNETVYPELLQPVSIQPNTNESEYAYAIYINDKLIIQTNDYPFPVLLKNDTLQTGQHFFFEKTGSSELWYRLNNKKTIVVVHFHSLWLEIITLFSYLFGIEILLAAFILLYQLYFSFLSNPDFEGRLISLSLRQRVHFSMLAVVLVSFIIIGIVTILFFTGEYKNSNIDKLESAMQAVGQSVQQYMKSEGAFVSENNFDTVCRSTPFKYFIAGLAGSQKIDINIYNSAGDLDVTSQDDIYDKGLLARHIRPDAYYQLAGLGKSILIQEEQVGNLVYLSCYVPLRDEQGSELGYINVPFFSSERDLNFQISNIVVTLINLYAFIFLISSLFTVFITRWLTRTLNIIIRQFSKVNLQRNELIDWPYNDEIGFLVREYNKMVRKVEENAILLVQSERETAWREMARQVAHEIKNPLTPMKLNIQYLQNALRNDYPNVKELADRVSDSLIEQIDNLAYIASEFSNFAAMPEARPEEIDLSALLSKAAELYFNDENIKVSLSVPAGKVIVFSDRSQLIRVFTNLLENAKQSVPEGRSGLISISMIQEGDKVKIEVTDNGAGIPSEIIPKIFQPYFTTKSSGTGLGLAMTKKIIEFWKGEIWFVTNENEGTTFFITLPLLSREA